MLMKFIRDGIIIKKETFALFAILVAAFAVRFLFWRHEYLISGDPYYHYDNFRNLAYYGHILFPLGLYTPPLLVSFFLSPFGISDYNIFRITASIFGVGLIFIFYYFTKEVFDSKVALLSAAILAFTPPFILRTLTGHYRGDPFSMFFVVLAFYLFLVSFRDNSFKGKSYLLALFGGVSLALSGIVWTSGYIFANVVLAAFILAAGIKSFVYDEENRDMIFKYSLLIGSSIFFIHTLSYLGLLYRPLSSITGFTDFSRIIFPSTLFVLLFLSVVRGELKKFGPIKRFSFVLGLGLISFSALFIIYPEIIDRFLNLYRSNYSTGSYQTTAELRTVTIGAFLQQFNIIWLFSYFGLIYLISKGSLSRKNIFIMIWLLGGTFVMKVGVRGTFVASIPFALLAGYGMACMMDILKKMDMSRLMRNLKVYRIVPFLLLVSIALNGVSYSLGATPRMNDDWYDALLWEKENLPGDSVVLAWWDYGYWINTIGGGEAIVDPGQNQVRVRDVADVYFEDDPKAVENFFKKYEVDHLVISSDQAVHIPAIRTIRGSKEKGTFRFHKFTGERTIMNETMDSFDESLLVKTFPDGSRSAIFSRENLYSARIYYKNNGSFQKSDPDLTGKPVFENGSFYLSYGDNLTINSKKYAVYIPKDLENLFFTSLLYFEGSNFDNLVTLIYSNPRIKIYKANYNITKVGSLKTRELEYSPGEKIIIEGYIKSSVPFEGKLNIFLEDSSGSILLEREILDVNENSSIEVEYILPMDVPRGKYSLKGLLLSENNTEIDSYRSQFSLVSR